MEESEVFRWVLDVDSLWPAPPNKDATTKATAHWATGNDANYALGLLTSTERDKVLRFLRPSDAKLSLGSCLLKRRAVSSTCDVSWSNVVITQDSNRKPCFKPSDSEDKEMEFNVSHHGTLVALVGCSSSTTNLGVDVVQINWNRDYAKVMEDGFEAWAHVYEMVFSEREINDIAGYRPVGQIDPHEEVRAKLRHFYAHWCLKEAYVKMKGEALMAPWLKDLEFRNVQVPLPNGQMLNTSARTDDWGQTCSDIEIWFHGQRVTDVRLEIQAFRDDYMIGTACSNVDVHLSTFHELSVEHDVYPRR